MLRRAAQDAERRLPGRACCNFHSSAHERPCVSISSFPCRVQSYTMKYSCFLRDAKVLGSNLKWTSKHSDTLPIINISSRRPRRKRQRVWEQSIVNCWEKL